jgi:pimeloyl-ACP methyl ester carboxylesterase
VHVERAGESGPRVVLVHGSAAPGWKTWAAQRPLASDHRLVVPHRSGYPPNPPLDRIDFEVQAAEIASLIEPGSHLVGHSYGGVVALHAAALVPDRLRSLVVVEPPAYGVARGVPEVEELISRLTAVFSLPDQSPRSFLLRFLQTVGVAAPVVDPLPPDQEASVRATMVERPPWEADIPVRAIRDAKLPVLVVSGAHATAWDAVCDVLVERLAAEQAVIRGHGHAIAGSGAILNDRLRAFWRTRTRA